MFVAEAWPVRLVEEELVEAGEEDAMPIDEAEDEGEGGGGGAGRSLISSLRFAISLR